MSILGIFGNDIYVDENGDALYACQLFHETDRGKFCIDFSFLFCTSVQTCFPNSRKAHMEAKKRIKVS